MKSFKPTYSTKPSGGVMASVTSEMFLGLGWSLTYVDFFQGGGLETGISGRKLIFLKFQKAIVLCGLYSKN